MTKSPLPGQTRSVGAIVSALLALVVLLLLVVGIPVVLVVVAPPLPHVNGLGDLASMLMRPDDGTLFLAVLAMVAWLAWATFAVSVAVETVAVIRGLPTPRLPGLGLPQRSAATLVGAAAVLLSTSPWQTVAPEVRPVVATAPTIAGVQQVPTKPIAAKVESRAKEKVGPTITVRPGDTLWALAERHLGAGTRYRDIAELNYDRPQPDGRTLNKEHWIFPGWNLRLPADATTNEQDDNSYVVREGDTLSEIAADHMGAADRYPEIAQASRHVEQPNGAHLTDPDRILPGWTLRLPDEKATPKRDPSRTTDRDEPKPHPTDDAPIASSPLTASAPTPVPTPAATPTQRPEAALPTGAATTSPSPSPTASPSATAGVGAADDDVRFPSRLVLGLGGLAAAGFITQLSLRRRRQQSTRQAGERISMPDRAEALTEHAMRAAQEPFTAADIRRALRALAKRCSEVGRDLPRLLFVRVTPESVYLTFADDEPDPPAGFLATGERTWRIGDVHRRTDLEALAEADPDPDPEAFDPYPALVTLGVADGDTLLMVNLEAAGTLTVVGDPDSARAVLLALVAELSTSTLSENTSITLSGGLQGLAEVHDLGRVRAADDRQLGQLAGLHRREVVDVLTATPAIDVHLARSQHLAEDVWAPEVFAVDAAVPDVDPWLGTVILGCSELPGSGWNLALAPSGVATLSPAQIMVEPQRLDDEVYQHLLTLLATADQTPAPVVPVQVTRINGAASTPTAVPAIVPSVAVQPEPRSPILVVPAPPSVATPAPAAPRVLVLGPVVVEGADDEAIPHRRRRATELVAYLALHPGATAHQIDEAIWPGRRVGKQTRNSFVSRARHWLGRSPDGDPYLPLVAAEGDYRLSPAVTSDWHDFQCLVAEGFAAGDEGAPLLAEALALVRGRPFLGVDPTTYAWAEADTQEMISAIVDAAHELAGIRISAGDHQGAQVAAAQGLLAEPCSDLLYRDSVKAATARGDKDEVTRLGSRFRAQLEVMDLDAELGDLDTS